MANTQLWKFIFGLAGAAAGAAVVGNLTRPAAEPVGDAAAQPPPVQAAAPADTAVAPEAAPAAAAGGPALSDSGGTRPAPAPLSNTRVVRLGGHDEREEHGEHEGHEDRDWDEDDWEGDDEDDWQGGDEDDGDWIILNQAAAALPGGRSHRS